MLSTLKRIQRAYFKEIFQKGSFFQSENLALRVLSSSKSSKLASSRFAFSVSSKITKSAVKRNKLRRQGYSIIRELDSSIKPSYLAVFVLKKGALDLDFEKYKAETKNLLAKAKII